MEKDHCPLVSICMPAYNAGNYIIQAVNSIIQQSYTNWELIIVNDGSTDNTATELEKITDNRVKTYYQENKGQCAAANKAYSISKGQLIKFIDADDLISPNFIEAQINLLSNRTDAIVSASWGRFYKNDLNTFKLSDNLITFNCKPIDWLVKSMFNKQAMMQCGLWLIPRTILESVGLWDEELSLINDFEFFTRVLLNAQQVLLAEKAILYYRSGIENSLSSLKSRKGAVSAYSSIYKATSYMLKVENSPRVKKITADCFQNFIYTVYPCHKDLIYNAENKVKEFGGSNSDFPAGGLTKILKTFIGWKLTKKIKAKIQL